MSVPDINPDLKWARYRFFTYSDDPRPVVFNPKYPWWISGSGEDEKGDYYVCIAYIPIEDSILTYWPEAKTDSTTYEEKIEFTDRFPKPEYFKE